MSGLSSSSSTRRDRVIRVPILIFIRDEEVITEQRETCPRCESTGDTWICYGTIEETGNYGMECQCGLKFEQVREHVEKKVGDDDH